MKQRNGVLVFIFLCSSLISQAQAPTAVVNGQVRDTSGAAIAQASVEVINDATNVRYTTETNDEGIYSVPNLPPGTYHIRVSKQGFKTIVHPDIALNVQDAKAIGFTLPVGPISDTVTVEGGAPLINTQDAAVSTVVDRQFAENLPMNGRSFQTLIQLTPGVVLTPSNQLDAGQFSVNGQRASSNYFMIDGVSANIGITALTNVTGNGAGGALPGFSVQGGTNGLVSVDALQEFRIQTSTYAPEFGRTPGGQVSIVTRSGTNQVHGTAFDYLRNDVFDANDWFADRSGLKKPAERQNDFGGTFGGPVFKDRTFFFFSYEGLRLRTPQTALTLVPSISARQSATAGMQPFLNAFPLPTGPEVLDSNGNPTGDAPFNSSYSNRSTLDANSLRLDHRLNQRLSFFGRYNYSPSQNVGRLLGNPLSDLTSSRITIQTATAGALWTISLLTANDIRFNYSRTNASGNLSTDDFGGATPLTASVVGFPGGIDFHNGIVGLIFFDLGSFGFFQQGNAANNTQKQFNVVDNLSRQQGAHSLKFGVDYRRLTPTVDPAYSQNLLFLNVSSAKTGQLFAGNVRANRNSKLIFNNVGVFAQDTWRLNHRLTLTYGLRWDIDVSPSTSNGPNLLAVSNFNDLSQLSLAPTGTPIFNTRYSNIAPRVGMAYQIFAKQNWQAVVRGGFGLFFDLATQEVGRAVFGTYPFSAIKTVSGTFPLSSASATPPDISVSQLPSGNLFAVDPDLDLPRVYEWNLALEQSLGFKQAISISYIGSAGRRLIGTEFVIKPNANFGGASLVGNRGISDYDALQVQFQRQLYKNVQALASYSLAHSIDTASASSNLLPANAFSRQLGSDLNRGPSDFDARHAFAAGVTYEIPTMNKNPLVKAMLRGWSLQNVFQARSALPVDANFSNTTQLFGSVVAVRPDLVSGIPLYLYGSQYPGGKAFNNTVDPSRPGCLGPFCPPPKNSSGGFVRQGDFGRNVLRGFGVWQWDFGVHRDFPIRESVRLQFRAEFFNLLNHPNFGPPVGTLSSPAFFGVSQRMLGASLNTTNTGAGGFAPIYQIGGPRSIQLALKFSF